MRKEQVLANEIEIHMRDRPRSSGEIHRRYPSHGSQSVTSALRLLIKDKRAVRERVSGQKGFLYRLSKTKIKSVEKDASIALKFDGIKRTWNVEGAAPLKSNDAQICQADASAAFTAWWAVHGPFSDEYWKGAPKTPDIEKYQESFKAPAYTAWVAAIKYAKTGNWAATWEEVTGCPPKTAQ